MAKPKTGIVSIANATPDQVIARGRSVADVLKELIEEKKLYVGIGDKKYVLAEGWSTMGAMLGVFPHIVTSTRLTGPDRVGEVAYETRVVLKLANGDEVGSGEAMASSKERNAKGNAPIWASNEFSIRSMAQTRAVGKAFRLAYSWIMNLAGYEPTPAEEMPMVHAESVTPPKSDWSAPTPPAEPANKPPTEPITPGQVKLIEQLVTKHREDGKQYANVEEFEAAAGIVVKNLTKYQGQQLIDKLLARVKEINDRPEA